MKHCLAVLVVPFVYLTFVQGTCLTLSGIFDICYNFPGNNKYFTSNKNEFWICKGKELILNNCTAPTNFFNPVTGECEEDDPNNFVYDINIVNSQCKEENDIIGIENKAGVFAHCQNDLESGYMVWPGICHDPEGGPCKAITGNKECVAE